MSRVPICHCQLARSLKLDQTRLFIVEFAIEDRVAPGAIIFHVKKRVNGVFFLVFWFTSGDIAALDDEIGHKAE